MQIRVRKMFKEEFETIEVERLEEAISESSQFKSFKHVPPIKTDIERQRYWSDVYQELKKLKNA